MRRRTAGRGRGARRKRGGAVVRVHFLGQCRVDTGAGVLDDLSPRVVLRLAAALLIGPPRPATAWACALWPEQSAAAQGTEWAGGRGGQTAGVVQPVQRAEGLQRDRGRERDAEQGQDGRRGPGAPEPERDRSDQTPPSMTASPSAVSAAGHRVRWESAIRPPPACGPLAGGGARKGRPG